MGETSGKKNVKKFVKKNSGKNAIEFRRRRWRRTRSDASRASNTNRTKCVCRSVGRYHTQRARIHGIRAHTLTHRREQAGARANDFTTGTQAGQDDGSDTERWKRFTPRAQTVDQRSERVCGGACAQHAHTVYSAVAAAVCINNVKIRRKKKGPNQKTVRFREPCARARMTVCASAFVCVCVCVCVLCM